MNSSFIISAVIIAVVAPTLHAYLMRRQHQGDLMSEHRRQEVVTERVETIAAESALNRKEINDKLDEIHTLVNSKLTSALSGQRAALAGQLVLLLEADEDGSRELAIIAVRTEIADLDRTLAEREHQDLIVSVQKATDEQGG